jgi:hypothetical protein
MKPSEGGQIAAHFLKDFLGNIFSFLIPDKSGQVI